MRFFRLSILSFLFLTIACAEAIGQLPAFSAFWLTPQLTAPTAMAGNDALQVSAHFRRQGFEESTGYRTYLLSGQIPLYSKTNTPFGTLGVNVLRDESGASYLFSTSGGMLTYLYDAQISQRHHLVGGVQGAYYWRRIDWNTVTTKNQFVNGGFDPTMNTGEEFSDDPSRAFITNVGLAYYLSDFEGNPVFHIGGALTNANSGSFTYLVNPESESVPRNYTGYAHIRLLSNPYFEIVSDLYLRNQNKVNDLIGGFQLRKGTKPRTAIADNHLGLGLFYTQDHTGVIALQIIQPNWLIGLNYDLVFGNNPLQKMQNAVEVSLGWRATRSKKVNQYNSRKYRRKLPWSHKKKLPWQE